VLDGKCFRLCQLSNFETLRLTQFDALFDLKDGFTAASPHMDMNWAMFVAIEKNL
jgi:hypothetical protein